MSKRQVMALLALSLSVAVALVVGVVLASNTYPIDWRVLAGGGGPMSSTNYALNSTLGQPVIGPAGSANYDLAAGYWDGVAIQIGPYRIRLFPIFKNYQWPVFSTTRR